MTGDYRNYTMKTIELKLTRIGNSKGVRLPVELIHRYGFSESLAVEVCKEGLFLKPKKRTKLSWEETAREMAASDEDWNEWNSTISDGIENCTWDQEPPTNVQAWERASFKRERRGKDTMRAAKPRAHPGA